MLLTEFILTEGRGGHLYHATRIEYAMSILRTNVVEDRTKQTLGAKRGKRYERAQGANGEPIYGYDLIGGKEVSGVSLTRSYEFALDWKSDVIFVFDHRRLAQDYSIKPIDHIHSAGWDYYSPGAVNMRKEWYNQYEEFLIGPIRNVSRYLISINIAIHDLDHVDLFNENPELYRHPLVNRVYPRNYARLYNRQKHEDSIGGRKDFIWADVLKKQGKTDAEALATIRGMKPMGDDDATV